MKNIEISLTELIFEYNYDLPVTSGIRPARQNTSSLSKSVSNRLAKKIRAI